MRLNWRAWMALAGMTWLVAAGPARAGLPETPRVRQLTVADGLPSNAVWGIAEDADGYLWLATGDGLARYDGVNFRVWRIGQGLRANVVQSIAIDRDNRVLAGTLGQGLAIFDAERNGFRYLNRRPQPALDGDSVWAVTSTANPVPASRNTGVCSVATRMAATTANGVQCRSSSQARMNSQSSTAHPSASSGYCFTRAA